MLEDYINKIEAYLDNELSEKEVEEFESFLQSSPDLQEELDAEIATRNILDFDQEERILETFRALDLELDKKKTIIIRRNWGIGIAAVISLLIFIFYPSDKPSAYTSRPVLASNSIDEILVAEYPQLMKKDSGIEKLDEIKRSKSFYQEGNWQELEKIVAQNDQYAVPKILLGITYIKEGEYSKALDFYDSPKLPQRIKPYANFYKGIIFSLQEGLDIEACEAFTHIIDQGLGETYISESLKFKQSLSCPN